MVVAMFWRKPVICLVLAVVTTLHLGGGEASDSQAAVRSSAVAGTGRLGSVKREAGTRIRRGSLWFRHDEHGAHTPSRVLDAKLKHMDPTVQCSDTAMSLKVKGVRAPPFLVDSGKGSLTPFSHMPSNCGFSVKRSRRDVTFMAPYRGCHVTQQAGSYVLPLHLSGTPIMMSCPTISPLPSVTCFKSGMVLKIGGTMANEVQVKVSGTWMPVLSVCSSCGITTEPVSGGMMLFAPYNRGQCVTTEEDEYSLYLLMGDVELLVTCPSTMTSPPSKDGGQVALHPQAPVPPKLPEKPVAAMIQPPLLMTATLSPQQHQQQPQQQPQQLPPGPAKAEGNPFSKFPYMPVQFPHPPQYPGHYGADDMSAFWAQLHMMQQLPQYSQQSLQYSHQLPGLPPFPMVPRHFQPTAPPTAPATTAAIVTQAPPVKHNGIPQHPQQLQHFPVFPHHYPFLPFRGLVPPEGQAGPSQMLKPPYPRMFQSPMLPNLPTTTTTTAPTTSAPPTTNPTLPRPHFNPYPYLPYYVPQQAFMPLFPGKPPLPEQHGQQPHVPPQFYPSGY